MSVVNVSEITIPTVTKEAKAMAKRFKSLGIDIPLSKCQEVFVQSKGFKTFHDFQKTRSTYDDQIANDCAPLIVSGEVCGECGSQLFVASISIHGSALYDENNEWVEDIGQDDCDHKVKEHRTCYRCGCEAEDNLDPSEYGLTEIVAFSGQRGPAHTKLRERTGKIYVITPHGEETLVQSLCVGLDHCQANDTTPFFMLADDMTGILNHYEEALIQAQGHPAYKKMVQAASKEIDRCNALIHAHYEDLDLGHKLTINASWFIKSSSRKDLVAILENDCCFLEHSEEVNDFAERWSKDLFELLVARRVFLKNAGKFAPQGFTFQFDEEELKNWLEISN